MAGQPFFMKHSSKKSTDADNRHAGNDMKPMPSLVFNEVRFDSQEAEPGEYQPESPSTDEDLHLIHQSLNYQQKHSPLLPTNNPLPPKGAWGYIWLAVGAVMAVVIGVWVYSLPGRLSLSSWQETGEYKLLRATKDRWGSSFSASTTAQLLGEVDVSPLAQAIAAFNTTTSPTSTTSTASSTLPAVSSTVPTSTVKNTTTPSTSRR